MYKKAKIETIDRISDLPDSVLSHILSFLSTKEAFRTSVLSTRWRYLFTLVPNLNFELNDAFKSSRKKLKLSTIKSFMCFVDRMLFFHKMTNLDRFRLKCGNRVASDRVYGWISYGVWCGIKHLNLSTSSLGDLTLPGVLFTCKTLVTLRLDIHNFELDVPENVQFPNLKTLDLKSVEFSNADTIKRLLSGCGSLEVVVIEKCDMNNISNFEISHHSLEDLYIRHSINSSHCQLVIDTPNLAYFDYIDHVVAGYSLENLQSLLEANIDFQVEREEDLEADHATAFFRGISNVPSLILSPSSLKLLLSCKPLPAFATLVELNIHDSYWSLWPSTDKGLETLLSSMPELEELAFNQEYLCSLPEEVPPCLLFKLKVIEISEFIYDENCIGKAKYILKNGEALEKLIMRASYLSNDEKLKLSEVLLASPRKSKQCFILII